MNNIFICTYGAVSILCIFRFTKMCLHNVRKTVGRLIGELIVF